MDVENGAKIHHELANWISSFDPLDPHLDRQIFEALCLHEWFEIINSELLERLLSARDPLARSYATRIVGRWHDRLPAPLKYLRDSVADAHPRVRLEAVVAASQLMSTEAIETAVLALNAPTDRFIEAMGDEEEAAGAAEAAARPFPGFEESNGGEKAAYAIRAGWVSALPGALPGRL